MTPAKQMGDTVLVSGETHASIEGIIYRDVWLKDDPKVHDDALALGRRMPAPGGALPEDFWAQGEAHRRHDGSRDRKRRPGRTRD